MAEIFKQLTLSDAPIIIPPKADLIPLVELSGSDIKVSFLSDPRIARSVKNIYPLYSDEGNEWQDIFILPAEALNDVIRVALKKDWQISPEILTLKAERDRLSEERQQRIKQKIEEIERSFQFNPSDFYGYQLKKHQVIAIAWLLERCDFISDFHGGILADEMGLGKTLSALTAARLLQHYTGCRVVAIAPPVTHKGWTTTADRIKCEVDLFSWAKIAPRTDKPFVLIGDEAHYAQNGRSRRASKLVSLARHPNCKAAWLLTGTPLRHGRPEHLFPLLDAIACPETNSLTKFKGLYCQGVHKASRLNLLAKRLEPFMLRRLKDQVTDLPPKSHIKIQVTLSREQAREYDDLVRSGLLDFRRRCDQGKVDRRAESLVTLGLLRRVGSLLKTDAAIALATELLNQDLSVVIFCDFIESIDRIADCLAECAPTDRIKGETSKRDRGLIEERFQSRESRVLVASLKACGLGITLTAAHHLILVDRPYSPEDINQATDRIHRIGQDQPCTNYWLQLGKVDQKIDLANEKKSARIAKVLAGDRASMRGIDESAMVAEQVIQELLRELSY